MGKIRAKKQTKGKSRKKGLPWFAWLGIALGIVATIAFVRTYPINRPTL